MNLSTRYLVLIATGLALAAGVVAVTYLGVGSLGSMCGNHLIATDISPVDRAQVVVFERSCGATTGFSTQVTLLRQGEELPNKAGNVFVVDTDHGRVPSGPGGGPWVEAKWIGPDSILIRFHAGARVFQQATVVDGVRVGYLEVRRPGA